VKSSMKKHYIEWLAKYRWRWVGVLTFRLGLKGKAARKLLKAWVSEIERAERHKISWVAFPERGPANSSFHFHILLAGIGSHIYLHVKSWNQRAGHCALLVYDPRHPGNTGEGLAGEHRGIAYALKSLAFDDYEFLGQLLDKHMLVRHRRALRKKCECQKNAQKIFKE
jgi:hypothetical protein